MKIKYAVNVFIVLRALFPQLKCQPSKMIIVQLYGIHFMSGSITD